MAASSRGEGTCESEGDQLDAGDSLLSDGFSPASLTFGSECGQVGLDDLSAQGSAKGADGTEVSDRLALLEARPKAVPKEAVKVVDVDTVDTSGSPSADLHAAFDSKTLAVEKLRCMDKQQFKFPWERGTLKRIFGKDDPVPNKRVLLQPSDHNPFKVSLQVGNNAKVDAAIDFEEHVPSGAIFLTVVKSLEQLDYKKERAKKRAAAIRGWWNLISSDLGASVIGRKVLEEAVVDDHESYGLEVIDACFGLKSPGTLQKRLYALRAFSDWCTNDGNIDWLPLSESAAWRYIRHLKTIGAPATKAATFLEGSV